MDILLLAVALAPAVILLSYIYRMDSVEKEPLSLLFRLFAFGAVACIPTVAAELIGDRIIGTIFVPESTLYYVFDAFLVVGLAEEGFKYFFLKKVAWRSPEFNYCFDGIVYAVFVSLGFAALENIFYVLDYGLVTGFYRMFLAVPGHMAFAVYMGLFFGEAKLCEVRGDLAGMRRNQKKALFSAIALHGLYDLCLFLGGYLATIVFAALVLFLYIHTVRTIKKRAQADRPLSGPEDNA